MKNGELPAFAPGSVPNNQGNYEPTYGLTKREYFAAIAMQGLIHHMDRYDKINTTTMITHDAVVFADELLKALES